MITVNHKVAGRAIANPFAIIDGIIKHASELAERPVAAICPTCSCQLHLKRSSLQTPFFAHTVSSGCAPYETGLHLYAKELICRVKSITIPAINDNFGSLCGAKKVEFDECLSEILNKSHRYRPDVIAHIFDCDRTHTLNIEIKVHNAVSVDKEAKIQRSDISTVEIFLNPYITRDMDLADLNEHILHSAKREWVHINSNKRLALEIKRKNKRRAEQAALAVQLKNALANSRPQMPEPKVRGMIYYTQKDLDRIGFPRCIGVEVSGANVLLYGAADWQTLYWRYVLFNRVRSDNCTNLNIGLRYRDTRNIHNCELTHLYCKEILRITGEMARLDVKASEQLLRPIAEYHRYVSSMSDAIFYDDQHAYINQKYSRRAQRLNELERIIFRPFDRIPDDKDKKRRKELWLQSVVDGFEMTPLEMVFHGGQEWDQLMVEIERVNRAVLQNREPVSDFLGLPLFLENKRNADRNSS